MTASRLTIGPVTVSMRAGATGAGFSLSVGGPMLQRLHKGIADRVRNSPEESPEAGAIRARIADTGWYHTIDLGANVLTPIISETVGSDLEGDPESALMRYMGCRINCNWWRFSESGLVNLVRDAGFSDIAVVSRFVILRRGSVRDMRQIVIVAHND